MRLIGFDQHIERFIGFRKVIRRDDILIPVRRSRERTADVDFDSITGGFGCRRGLGRGRRVVFFCGRFGFGRSGLGGGRAAVGGRATAACGNAQRDNKHQCQKHHFLLHCVSSLSIFLDICRQSITMPASPLQAGERRLSFFLRKLTVAGQDGKGIKILTVKVLSSVL